MECALGPEIACTLAPATQLPIAGLALHTDRVTGRTTSTPKDGGTVGAVRTEVNRVVMPDWAVPATGPAACGRSAGG
jgi:hypothetical protein